MLRDEEEKCVVLTYRLLISQSGTHLMIVKVSANY